ncbi:MAG TPA: hypothetical protein VE621_12845 [Bryobacteraceae bacterium]|nr:hypothetical protein [Bryobacteraceae bacterium]
MDAVQQCPSMTSNVDAIRSRPLGLGDLLELRLLGGNQQLEHEQASATVMQVVGQALQPSRLPCIEGAVTFRVVANQHFAERWPKGFDMPGKVLAVFEIEFILPALLDAAGGGVTMRGTPSRIAALKPS